MTQILIVDSAGMPKEWVGYETAAGYYVNNKVLWEVGSKIKTLFGGISAATGSRSCLELSSILGVSGPLFKGKFLEHSGSRFATRSILYARDKHMCAYCGDVFSYNVLTIDHVLPKSKGGNNSWTNTVSACRPCNNRKGDRTPEQAKMPLLYVPYQPSVFEKMILKNRTILQDQMDFLLARVPENSRLHTN